MSDAAEDASGTTAGSPTDDNPAARAGDASDHHPSAGELLDDGLDDLLDTLPLDARFDRYATRLYMLAVRNPGVSRRHMVSAGIPSDAVGPTLDFLTDHGLVRAAGPDSWEAIPPDLALPSLAASYESRARHLRDSAIDLAHVYQRSRMPAEAAGGSVTVLRTTEELTTAAQVLQRDAAGEIWAAYDDSPRAWHLFGLDLDRHRERLLTRDGTPLLRRTTFDTRLMRHPRAGDVLMARVEGGEETRFLSDLPFSVVVADDVGAVVDLTSYDTSGAGSMLVRDRRLVLALRSLCVTWWDRATPLAWQGVGELDRDSVFILSLLAAGATDATMSAQIGVSQRTVERRVRHLMQRLGATTRFQAGVLAARRGWI